MDSNEIYYKFTFHMAEGVECFFGLSATANKRNGGNIVNSCYVKTKEGYVVIDSGPTYSYAQQANRVMMLQERLPVRYLINTTAEEAHILGSSFYKEQGAVLIGPKEHKKYENKTQFKLQKMITNDTFENTRIVSMDQYVESDETIYVGDVEIHIIKIIEDSDRYLIVHIPQRGIIFVGDMIFNNRLPSFKSGRSIVRWLKALKKIEGASWQRLISSHGINTKYSAIKNTKSYLTVLKDTVSQKIEEGIDKQSIVETTKMFSFREDNLYDKCHKNNVSLVYSELYQSKQKSTPIVEPMVIIPKAFEKKRPIKKEPPIKIKRVKSVPNIRYYSFSQAIKKATANRK